MTGLTVEGKVRVSTKNGRSGAARVGWKLAPRDCRESQVRAGRGQPDPRAAEPCAGRSQRGCCRHNCVPPANTPTQRSEPVLPLPPACVPEGRRPCRPRMVSGWKFHEGSANVPCGCRPMKCAERHEEGTLAGAEALAKEACPRPQAPAESSAHEPWRASRGTCALANDPLIRCIVGRCTRRVSAPLAYRLTKVSRTQRP